MNPTISTILDETTTDGIWTTITLEQVADQRYYFVRAAATDLVDIRRFDACYDIVSARKMMKRLTANVRRARTIARRAA